MTNIQIKWEAKDSPEGVQEVQKLDTVLENESEDKFGLQEAEDEAVNDLFELFSHSNHQLSEVRQLRSSHFSSYSSYSSSSPYHSSSSDNYTMIDEAISTDTQTKKERKQNSKDMDEDTEWHECMNEDDHDDISDSSNIENDKDDVEILFWTKKKSIIVA
ncbi:uncharacterized protein MONOS_5257 [Monocercomonoides exilis]|uniref:uncharacterized protein n=1 Tax=Monocercomonoides exilis TaxID=2049356 RepID=UPI00355A8521|nr:hypothetical protein MONOS_5257 [Monocercomonoides exilis]|eukprot:MONOS_5257.1-p1 / transcript=MONOS_5257.1 / gene=MONOS_5257 / organism=Monocercomonoides_exilis_PA203 / gene_product=unspecified product / transcript_product=unspecified product / location=Mono_scaffold00151:41279-41874(-) / protein_length=160 / sequence_SO=supercontig / SO=protein_coding / is_pseudo=false